ncbi:MAG: serine hydrolase domain-containing protein [Candidatus Hodarchaeota archaeon]
MIDHEELGIDSLSVVKNKYLCYEKYFEYYNHSNIHLIHSVTKSVISALIGIANSTGMIQDLDEPVVEIFSNRTIQNLDTRKETMTVRHLLEMKSGLEVNDLSTAYFSEKISHSDFTFRTNTTNVFPGTWLNFLYPDNDFTRLTVSSDWTQFALDKPMAADPGTEWRYSDCITHLLSTIIREKTGMNTEAFAKQYLFDPLNITDYLWWGDPSGLSLGADGL